MFNDFVKVYIYDTGLLVTIPQQAVTLRRLAAVLQQLPQLAVIAPQRLPQQAVTLEVPEHSPQQAVTVPQHLPQQAVTVLHQLPQQVITLAVSQQLPQQADLKARNRKKRIE